MQTDKEWVKNITDARIAKHNKEIADHIKSNLKECLFKILKEVFIET